jgi:hypothetical protein
VHVLGSIRAIFVVSVLVLPLPGPASTTQCQPIHRLPTGRGCRGAGLRLAGKPIYQTRLTT